MKNILLTLVTILFFGFANGQSTTRYIEFNTGISTGLVPLFPGGSFMYGATTTYNSGIVLDYEGGFAFPSLVTGKAGIGYAVSKDADITVGIRPWPASTYLQLKLNRPNKKTDLVITAENMWARDLFVQTAIFTIGWRLNAVK